MFPAHSDRILEGPTASKWLLHLNLQPGLIPLNSMLAFLTPPFGCPTNISHLTCPILNSLTANSPHSLPHFINDNSIFPVAQAKSFESFSALVPLIPYQIHTKSYWYKSPLPQVWVIIKASSLLHPCPLLTALNRASRRIPLRCKSDHNTPVASHLL